MAVLILIAIVCSAIFYPEPYLWIEELISNLGRLTSRSNLDNTTSRLIFSICFMIISFGCFISSILYFIIAKSPSKNLDIVKGILLILAAIGALGTSIPAGLPATSAIHIWGTVLFIFSFIIYLTLAQYIKYEEVENQSKLKNIDDISDKIMIGVVIFAAILFLVAYILWWIEWMPILQKILVFILIILVFMLDLDDI